MLFYIAKCNWGVYFKTTLRWNGSPVCGGSILDANHVVTAAHCIHDRSGILLPPSFISIVVGNLLVYETPSIHEVEEIIPHENYNNSSYTADIAILKVLKIFTKHL